jgi:hypothetical protein
MKLKHHSYTLGVCCIALVSATTEGFSVTATNTLTGTTFSQPKSSYDAAYSSSSSSSLSSVSDDEAVQTPTPVKVDKYDTTKLASQLDDILRSKSSSLLDDLNDIRKNESQEEAETFLNTIITVIDNVDGEKETSLPWWTKLRFTARISRRSRIASLRRVLDLSTPSAEDTESLGNDTDAEKRRRRRALVVLLRSLSQTQDDDEEAGDSAVSNGKNGNVIYKIEKVAKRDLKRAASNKDMDSRLPPGLETPKYDVIVKRPLDKGGYEVRNYEAFSVCSVPMKKPRPDVENTDQKVRNPQLAGASSFGALAGYLFGKNEEQKAMKMTTPVLTQGQGEEKQMSFVLPSDYWTDDGISAAPTPLQNSLVKVRREEGGCRAAIMFGGFASSKDVNAKKEQLLNGLKSDKEWVPVEDDVTIAQYNDPFTPPWKRRNEVSVAVKSRDSQ